MDLLIVIINYKTPEMTCDCLASLSPEIANLNIHVVVVDNDSKDDSVKQIQSWMDKNNAEQVHLIPSEFNGGFAFGNNLGLSFINARYYLLLNSDTVVRKGAIETLLETIKTNESAGIVSPRLEWLDGKPQQSCFNMHTPVSEFLSAAKTGFFSKLFKKYVVAKPLEHTSSYSDWTSFACVMIRQEVFKQIGLMDEGFFMYFEDAEFCHRARKAGWKILNNPEAHVVHLRGGSSPVKKQTQLRKRLPLYYYESRSRYFYQIYGRSGLFMANILWCFGATITRLRSLISSNYTPDISEKQWQDIWTNFFNPLKKYTHPDDYKKT
ncbi:family 2 glycosyl transferase [Methylophaga nitratireducenticrescens]|nr:family 2 glycosyl transferase [Methylophaga nitratireducenticrescens]AUZ86012.1 family 2 glycosyl transferase [Methylophaga nitratireducenticrescens]